MDDFSFPTMQTDQDSLRHLPFPHLAASPLWFTSPPTADNPVRRSHSFKEEVKRDPDADTNNLTVCSSGRLTVDEEKMDMLWEDFNEELIRASREMASENDSRANADESVAMTVDRCEWSASKSGSIIHHRRPSLLLILKVLKKLFLIQKTSFELRKLCVGAEHCRNDFGAEHCRNDLCPSHTLLLKNYSLEDDHAAPG